MTKYRYQDRDELRGLYVDQDLSQQKIADKLDVGKSTISRYVRKFELNQEKYPWRDEGVLRGLYWEDGHSIKDISEKLDTDVSTIHHWMVKLDIPRETAYYDRTYPWHDEELLRHLYFEEERSMQEIADRLDTSLSVIIDWFDNHGIETPSFAEAGQMARRVERTTFYTDHHGYENAMARVGDKTKRVTIHRLVAVAEYGYEEVAGKVVHHKNGIPWDNRPGNLAPMTDSEHKSLHAKERTESGVQGFG